jgi:hypothetical protein
MGRRHRRRRDQDNKIQWTWRWWLNEKILINCKYVAITSWCN